MQILKKEGSSLKTASIGRLWGSDSNSAAPHVEALSHCCGNWLSHLDWDSERYSTQCFPCCCIKLFQSLTQNIRC